MFVVLLKFSQRKKIASEFMGAHNEWVRKNVDEGFFVLVGSLHPNAGGAIIASGLSREQLERIVDEDPFVRENIVNAEIVQIKPGITDDRLSFLKD